MLILLAAALLPGKDLVAAVSEQAFVLKLGLGYGYLLKGAVVVPILWRSQSPVLSIDMEKTSDRFAHHGRAWLGPSGSIYSNGQKRPGNNRHFWLPLDYSFTWFCSRNAFKWNGLDWGFGGTVQFIHFRESLDLQEGQWTRFWQNYFGLGFHTAFRWRSPCSGWNALLKFTLTVSLPWLSRAGLQSNVIPEHQGGNWGARAGLLLRLERRIADRWLIGINLERDAGLTVQTASTALSFDEMVSGGTILISYLALKVGYLW